MSDPGRLQDASGAARWARILVLANAVLTVATGYLGTMTAIDMTLVYLGLGIGVAQLVSYLAAGVVSLRWLYLANGNARALGATDLMGSPGLAVAWFFIPLANLFMPYLTLRDTWRASVRPRDWQAIRAPVQILFWWACWLVSGVTSTIVAVADYRRGYVFVQEPEIAQLAMVSILFWAAAGWFFAWTIGRIQEAQADPAHLGERFS